MGKIEAVIFDWAGTTVDFGCMAPVQAFKDAFMEAGIEPTLDEIRKPMGMLKRDHVKTMLSLSRIRNLWNERYGREWTEEDVDRVYLRSEQGILHIVENFAELKPYVLEAVETLRSMGIKIGSTTGYTDEMMSIVVPKAKEQGYAPDAWFSPDSTEGLGRPYPYMIYKNLQTLRVSDVRNVIKAGDTVADIREGKQAGAISVGIVEGSSVMGLCQEEFDALTAEEYSRLCQKVQQVYLEAGADYVIPNMKGLVPLMRVIEGRRV